MSRSFNRLWLLSALLLASQSWALGLGDIQLSSALNEPLRAEIALFSATPEEMTNLTVRLASVETFERYDLDRPLFLTNLEFELVVSGGVDGSIVRITSAEPVTEPFVTFLVEAVWSRGRLLREYTLLLDPPTFALPPATQTTQAVTAPTRATQADRGQIQRPAPRPPAPAPQPTVSQQPPAAETPAQEAPLPAADDIPATVDDADFDTQAGGDIVVQRGDTLWGISQSMRPDSRLTVNQTMLAIYEANPDAFGGNINVLSAGASLRIPSADEVFRIARGDALEEVLRHNDSWDGTASGFAPPAQAVLELVPPDEDVVLFDDDAGQTAVDDAVVDIADPVESRIGEIETLLLEQQNSLIEIGSNELAALRVELAELRGEEPPEPLPVEDAVSVDVDETVADEQPEPVALDDDAAAVDAAPEEVIPEVVAPAPAVVASRPAQDRLVDTLMGYLFSIWGIIGGALLAAIGLLAWFARRSGGVEDEEDGPTGTWEALDHGDLDVDTMASTERLRIIAREDESAIVVVEGESPTDEDELSSLDTLDVPAFDPAQITEPAQEEDAAAADESPDVLEFDEDRAVATVRDLAAAVEAERSIEDTFSSETAINLDQSDPVAEADFHMAYGLYDQAADLINGALAIDSGDEVLLAKLCEIYFVWGNRDAFIDAAGRMRAATGDQPSAEWDKIVIMGQQIASDHELFSGISAGAATREVDLEFGGDMEQEGVLDIDLAGSGSEEIIDIGDDTGQVRISDPTAEIEFDLSEDVAPEDPAVIPEFSPDTVETPKDDAAMLEMSPDTLELPDAGDTSELPVAQTEDTVETPAVEQQFANLDATSELPGAGPLGPNDATELASLDDLLEGKSTDATAEIDLADLGLDLDGLDDVQLASDDDETEDPISNIDAEKESQALIIDDNLAETGRNPTIAEDYQSADSDAGTHINLLDATGLTQVLSEDFSVASLSEDNAGLSDDDKTMLANPLDDNDDLVPALGADLETLVAPLDDEETTLADDSEFELADSEALPIDISSADSSTEDTGEMPGIPGSTDMDLDLDDLTAALKVSEIGDPVVTPGMADSAATVEQPMITPADMVSSDSGELNDGRTMTEVGTKLDLARAYVDMGDPGGARSILEEVLDEGDDGQRQQAQQLLESLPS